MGSVFKTSGNAFFPYLDGPETGEGVFLSPATRPGRETDGTRQEGEGEGESQCKTSLDSGGQPEREKRQGHGRPATLVALTVSALGWAGPFPQTLGLFLFWIFW